MKKELLEKELSKIAGGIIIIGSDDSARDEYLESCRLAYKSAKEILSRSPVFSEEEKKKRLKHILDDLMSECRARGINVSESDITD